MDPQFSPIIIAFALSACITGALAIISWRDWKTEIALPFTLLMAAASLWAATSVGEIISVDLPTHYFFVCLAYPGVVVVPVAWFLLVLHYTGGSRFITKRTIPLFFVIPVLSVLFVLTNPLHNLYYSSVYPVMENGMVVWVLAHGPLFWIQTGYSYALLLLGIALVVTRLYAARDIYRRQILILLLASAIPFAANLAYVFPIGNAPALDLTPLTFTLTGLIIVFGIIRYQLFRLTPIAYFQVFLTITDGVVVIDNRGRIVDANPAAEAIFATPIDKLVAQPVDDFLPQKTPFSLIAGAESGSRHVEISFPGNRDSLKTGDAVDAVPEYYDAACVPLDQDTSGRGGCLLLLRNITRRKRDERALEDVHKKLNLMASITRHDILNQISALNCYLALDIKGSTKIERAEFYEKEKTIIGKIQEEIEFTREYQNIGAGLPVWQDISRLLARTISDLDSGTVQITVRMPPCEVYADAMLDKVFFNLISNALQYGEILSRITITGEERDGFFIITVEDDGLGITEEDKADLFTMGFGRNTGLGLFLSREILTITGLTITENGEPGKGARFVIVVPPGAWRVPGPASGPGTPQ